MARLLFLALFVFGCGLNDRSPEPVVFYVIGDWGRMGSPNQQVVSHQMNEWAKKQSPDFIITTGDNFYDVGVSGLNDPHWQESFERVYRGEEIITKPWFVSLGNHDYGSNPDVEIQYSSISPRWRLPARYYTQLVHFSDGGKARLIFIDTSPFEKSYYQIPGFREKLLSQDTTRQKKWLDSLCALNDVEWKIVVGHHPLYTGGVRRNEKNTVRASLDPILIKNKVDAYFCGHEHDLQILKSADQPTHHFLSGAGSDIRPTGRISQTIFSASIQGFMVAELSARRMRVKVVDFKGNVLFEKDLVK